MRRSRRSTIANIGSRMSSTDGFVATGACPQARTKFAKRISTRWAISYSSASTESSVACDVAPGAELSAMVLGFEASRTDFASDPSMTEGWDSSLRQVFHKTQYIISRREGLGVEECRESREEDRRSKTPSAEQTERGVLGAQRNVGPDSWRRTF